MRYLLFLLSLLLVACAADDLDPQTADYHEQILSSAKANDGEVDEFICTLVTEAIDYLQATPELQTERAKLQQRRAEIEQEHAGLIPRMHALRDEMLSGSYPHVVTSNVWQAIKRDCVDAGHITEEDSE